MTSSFSRNLSKPPSPHASTYFAWTFKAIITFCRNCYFLKGKLVGNQHSQKSLDWSSLKTNCTGLFRLTFNLQTKQFGADANICLEIRASFPIQPESSFFLLCSLFKGKVQITELSFISRNSFIFSLAESVKLQKFNLFLKRKDFEEITAIVYYYRLKSMFVMLYKWSTPPPHQW